MTVNKNYVNKVYIIMQCPPVKATLMTELIVETDIHWHMARCPPVKAISVTAGYISGRQIRFKKKIYMFILWNMEYYLVSS